jgi:hypothetical protein
VTVLGEGGHQVGLIEVGQAELRQALLEGGGLGESPASGRSRTSARQAATPARSARRAAWVAGQGPSTPLALIQAAGRTPEIAVRALPGGGHIPRITAACHGPWMLRANRPGWGPRRGGGPTDAHWRRAALPPGDGGRGGVARALGQSDSAVPPCPSGPRSMSASTRPKRSGPGLGRHSWRPHRRFTLSKQVTAEGSRRRSGSTMQSG